MNQDNTVEVKYEYLWLFPVPCGRADDNGQLQVRQVPKLTKAFERIQFYLKASQEFLRSPFRRFTRVLRKYLRQVHLANPSFFIISKTVHKKTNYQAVALNCVADLDCWTRILSLTIDEKAIQSIVPYFRFQNCLDPDRKTKQDLAKKASCLRHLL